MQLYAVILLISATTLLVVTNADVKRDMQAILAKVRNEWWFILLTICALKNDIFTFIIIF
jgi:succinate dehydrogenase hydrophobic anchor subunit